MPAEIGRIFCLVLLSLAFQQLLLDGRDLSSADLGRNGWIAKEGARVERESDAVSMYVKGRKRGGVSQRQEQKRSVRK